MLPQHLVYKNELNREYLITLARTVMPLPATRSLSNKDGLVSVVLLKIANVLMTLHIFT